MLGLHGQAELPSAAHTAATAPNVATPRVLAKAALSHLELALLSLSVHVSNLDTLDRQALARYSAYLGSFKVDHEHGDSTLAAAEAPSAGPTPSVSRMVRPLACDDVRPRPDAAPGSLQPPVSPLPSLTLSGDMSRIPRVFLNKECTTSAPGPRACMPGLQVSASPADTTLKPKSHLLRGAANESGSFSVVGSSLAARHKQEMQYGSASTASVNTVAAGERLEALMSDDAGWSAGSRDLPELSAHGVAGASGGDHPSTEEWHARMMDVFEQLDSDGDGHIDRQELRAALAMLNLPPAHVAVLLKAADTTRDGTIDRLEWSDMVDTARLGDADAMNMFLAALRDRQAKNGRIYTLRSGARSSRSCTLSPDTRFFLFWDSTLVAALGYIAVAVPFNLAFGSFGRSKIISNIIDGMFMLDVLINFFTAYHDENGCLVREHRKIAMHYLRGWFTLDFVSSLPVESFRTGFLPDMQPAKLLRIGRAAKFLRILRIIKAVKLCSALSEWVEEQATSGLSQSVLKLVFVIMLSVLVCHGLACFMVISSDTWLEEYAPLDSNVIWKTYLAALYWAMTTVTTVGYGDITPVTDLERAYAVLAMVVGGCFYAYVVGSVSSIITAGDINSSAYQERIGLVQAWLNFHDELPRDLRRRIRRHFKDLLIQKTALDDNAVLNDLSPELRTDVAIFLVPVDVRDNTLFIGFPTNAFARLMLITRRISVQAEEIIVEIGDAGVGMYIVAEGSACFAQGHQWKRDAIGSASNDIGAGDSFGEEILLGLERSYQYTVITTSKVVLYHIPEDHFLDVFKGHHELIHRMRSNFVDLSTVNDAKIAVGGSPPCGRASLVNSNSGALPHGFSDAVIDSFEDVQKTLNVLVEALASPMAFRHDVVEATEQSAAKSTEKSRLMETSSDARLPVDAFKDLRDPETKDAVELSPSAYRSPIVRNTEGPITKVSSLSGGNRWHGVAL